VTNLKRCGRRSRSWRKSLAANDRNRGFKKPKSLSPESGEADERERRKPEVSLRDAPRQLNRAVSETGKESDLSCESDAGGKDQRTLAGASVLGISEDDCLALISGGSPGQSQEDPLIDERERAPGRPGAT